MRIALWTAGILAMVVATVVLIRQPILKGQLFQSVRPLYMLIAPPADLYEPLVVSPAELDLTGTRYRFDFEHKYAGKHQLGLRVEKRVPMAAKTYDWGARYRVTFSVGGRILKTEMVGENPSPWWRHNGSGFSLLRYKVPQDLPIGKPITCEISAMAAGSSFHAQYGSASFFIRKFGEI